MERINIQAFGIELEDFARDTRKKQFFLSSQSIDAIFQMRYYSLVGMRPKDTSLNQFFLNNNHILGVNFLTAELILKKTLKYQPNSKLSKFKTKYGELKNKLMEWGLHLESSKIDFFFRDYYPKYESKGYLSVEELDNFLKENPHSPYSDYILGKIYILKYYLKIIKKLFVKK